MIKYLLEIVYINSSIKGLKKRYLEFSHEPTYQDLNKEIKEIKKSQKFRLYSWSWGRKYN